MSFTEASLEIRQRFTETFQLLAHLETADSSRQGEPVPPDHALKGLFLVALYGSLERSANAIVEQAVAEISTHSAPSGWCNPAIFTVFHHSRVQSLRACKRENVLEKSHELFTEVSSENYIVVNNNPLADSLTNVDGSTLVSIAKYFGISNYGMDGSSLGRLNNLRERRNAVAHGRESAATAGERFRYPELRTMYGIVDQEITRLLETIRQHCDNKSYMLRQA